MLGSPADSHKLIGHVFSVSGSQASIRLAPLVRSEQPDSMRITVGKFLAIRTQRSSVVGVITDVDTGAQKPAGEAAAPLTACVDLLGELKETRGGAVRFQRGITEYPVIGDEADMLGMDGLRRIYDTANADTINIGQLQQDSSIGARIKIDDMLGKHFALFGGTGVGKSSGVAVILRQVLEVRPDLRVFLIDPHNEYGHSFGDRAQVLNPKNLRLPFWLFNFEETVDVFFRGRPGLEEEVEILAQLIPQAKNLFASTRNGEAHHTLQEARLGQHRLHRRHARPLSPVRSRRPDRRAHGQAGEPLDHDEVQPAHRAHRDGAQGPALRLHVRQRQRRRRHHGRGHRPAVPPARQRQADDGHAAGGLPRRGGRFGRLRARPHGLRVRTVERRRRAPAVRLRGGPPLRPRRPDHRLRADPQGHLAHRQGGPEVPACSSPS